MLLRSKKKLVQLDKLIEENKQEKAEIVTRAQN